MYAIVYRKKIEENWNYQVVGFSSSNVCHKVCTKTQ